MSIGTIITILSLVNGLLNVAKDAPAVVDEAKSLLAKVQPHIDDAGSHIKQAYLELKEKLA